VGPRKGAFMNAAKLFNCKNLKHGTPFNGCGE